MDKTTLRNITNNVSNIKFNFVNIHSCIKQQPSTHTHRCCKREFIFHFKMKKQVNEKEVGAVHILSNFQTACNIRRWFSCYMLSFISIPYKTA